MKKLHVLAGHFVSGKLISLMENAGFELSQNGIDEMREKMLSCEFIPSWFRNCGKKTSEEAYELAGVCKDIHAPGATKCPHCGSFIKPGEIIKTDKKRPREPRTFYGRF